VAIRVYICPWVGTGTRQDPFRSKASEFGYAVSTFFPSGSDGTPASPWVLSVVRSEEFSAIEADATCDDLFAGDLPQAISTREELLAFLRSRTLSDVPTARRNAIIAVLDEYGVVRSDLVGTTTVWRLMQRVASTLLERDDGFASSF
jgi:hypothetical protein